MYQFLTILVQRLYLWTNIWTRLGQSLDMDKCLTNARQRMDKLWILCPKFVRSPIVQEHPILATLGFAAPFLLSRRPNARPDPSFVLHQVLPQPTTDGSWVRNCKTHACLVGHGHEAKFTQFLTPQYVLPALPPGTCLAYFL